MSSSSKSNRNNNLPIVEGAKARTIDKDVTEKIGRVRILESVAMRIADSIMYHIVPQLYVDDKQQQQQQRRRASTPLLFVAGKGNNGANVIATARILWMRGWRNIQCCVLLPEQDTIDAAVNADVLLRPNMTEQLELYRQFVVENDYGSSNDDDDDDDDDENENDESIPKDQRLVFLESLISVVDHFGTSSSSPAVIVDGILGTGIDRPPRGASLDAIRAINTRTTKTQSSSASDAQNDTSIHVLSVDMPSGLNHVTGEAPGEAIHATWTLNLHMIKSGQIINTSKEYIGELWSAESALGFTSFGDEVTQQFESLYEHGPIVKVSLTDNVVQEETHGAED